MKRKDIKDVFFDLDHTIYDFETNAKNTFVEAFKRYSLDHIDAFMDAFSVINESYWTRFAKGEIAHNDLRYGRLRDSFSEIDQKVDDHTICQLSEYFVHNLPNQSQLLMGAIEVLEYLHPKYNLHIITNGPAEVQVRKMKNARLSHYFRTVTHSELAGVKKPHPQIFEYALKASGANKEASLMIGDSLTADVFGAMDVGIQAIYFNEHRKTHTHKITEIYELIELKQIL